MILGTFDPQMIADDWIRILSITIYLSVFYDLVISDTPELLTILTFSSSPKMHKKLLGQT